MNIDLGARRFFYSHPKTHTGTNFSCPLPLILITKTLQNMVEAAGVEPASLTNLPAATTCLVRKDFSAMR
jgi:hypothetical protein